MRSIPTTMTRGQPTDYDSAGGFVRPLPATPEFQQAPQQPSAALPALPGLPSVQPFHDPLGRSAAFAQSVNNSRALKQYQGGTFADLRAQGKNEQEAGRAAYAGSQLAAADLGTGGYFQQREMTSDANRRANATNVADVGKTASEAGVNNSVARIGIPAVAGVRQAEAGEIRQNTAASRLTLPESVRALQIGNQGATAQLPYAGPQAAANVGLTQAQAQAQGVNGQQLKTYQEQLRQAQMRIQHLESLLVARPTPNDLSNPTAPEPVYPVQRSPQTSGSPYLNAPASMGGGPAPTPAPLPPPMPAPALTAPVPSNAAATPGRAPGATGIQGASSARTSQSGNDPGPGTTFAPGAGGTGQQQNSSFAPPLPSEMRNQIFNEAGGDVQKATQLAIQRGYDPFLH